MTADEMFRELGYRLLSKYRSGENFNILYENDEDEIIVAGGVVCSKWTGAVRTFFKSEEIPAVAKLLEEMEASGD